MEFIYFILTIGILIFLFLYGRMFFIHKKRETIIKNFESYTVVMQYYLHKAYEMIHKDQILVYSVEATTLPDVEFHKASIDFIQLVEKLMGQTLVSEMTFFYGDYDTFLFNCMEYFNTRYDDDEIRKVSMSDMMEKEVDSETI